MGIPHPTPASLRYASASYISNFTLNFLPMLEALLFEIQHKVWPYRPCYKVTVQKMLLHVLLNIVYMAPLIMILGCLPGNNLWT